MLPSSLFIATFLTAFSSTVYASTSCGGPLSESARDGFERLFLTPYTPNLSHMGGPTAEGNFAKKISSAEISRLGKPTPTLAVSAKLDAANAKWLKNKLNEEAQSEVPGWVSTALGLAAPQAWIGVSADVMVQLINGAGDAGRLEMANIAGTVSEGGVVTVFERIADDAAGKPQFLWSYAYTAVLNGRSTTVLFSTCRADVVHSS